MLNLRQVNALGAQLDLHSEFTSGHPFPRLSPARSSYS